MSILIPITLPAYKNLLDEGFEVYSLEKALNNKQKKLNILIVNLMPKKIETELQLLRLLGKFEFLIKPTFLKTSTYASKNTPKCHLDTFYKTLDEIKHLMFDGIIITGAPIEHMDFEQVSYWNELKKIFDFANTNSSSIINICWAAQASLYYKYNIPKYIKTKKIFGIYDNIIIKDSPLVKNLKDSIPAPHSRFSYNLKSDISKIDDLEIIAESDQAGIAIIQDKQIKNIFITCHMEYDLYTLQNEYLRDLNKNINPIIPNNYYPDNDSKQKPIFSWNKSSLIFYKNWLNLIYNKKIDK